MSSKTSSQVLQDLQFDTTTGALVTMDTIHHEVHEGELFTAEYTAASVADAGTVRMVFATGAKQPHLSMSVNAGGNCQIYIYEGVTYTGGTAVPVYNNNRLSTNTPTVSVKHTPSAGTAGTVAIVNGRLLPGGTSATTRVGGAVRPNVEYALGTSTNYFMDVVNKSGGAITVTSILEWYEETL